MQTPDFQIIDLTPENIASYGVCGYKDVNKHLELRRKVEWFERYYPQGLRIKALLTPKGGYQGMIEFIPGSLAHRPVNAHGYMFIHCLFVGFNKEYKGKGYASLLIDVCISEAKKAGMMGVAVVTRKGSFMAKKDIFLKKKFALVAHADPDFELLVLKFDTSNPNPQFIEMSTQNYSEGLTVFRSPQCPYSVKNVNAIMQTAHEMQLNPKLIEMDDHETARQSPCAFGTFCIVNNGSIISHHPISNTRFQNIMKTGK